MSVRSIFILSFLAALTMLASSCGNGAGNGSIASSTDALNACVAPDQTASFMAPVAKFPITIVADSTFNNDELNHLIASVLQWNQVGTQVIGQTIFRLRVGTIDAKMRSLDPRTCTDNIGGENQFYIVRVDEDPKKLTTWTHLGFNENIPGATVRCSNTPLLGGNATLAQQIVYMNPRLADPTQFESIVVHELGHTIGLDHSCIDGKGRADYAGCANLALQNPYRQAVMYPSLSRGSGSIAAEVRSLLQTNDKQRTQCLYSGK